MEITSSSEHVVNWIKKVKDWDLHAGLPSDLNLSDGKSVNSSKAGDFNHHGTDFGKILPMLFSMAIPDIEKIHPDANLLAVLPIGDNQEIVWYKFRNFRTQTATDKRSGISPAILYLLFDKGDGVRFVDAIKEEPTLMDGWIAAKFPELVKQVEIQPWKELLLLPEDLIFNQINTQVKVLSSKI